MLIEVLFKSPYIHFGSFFSSLSTFEQLWYVLEKIVPWMGFSGPAGEVEAW